MSTHYHLQLPPVWIDSEILEDRGLIPSGEPHTSDVGSACVSFPAGCKVMVDAGARLLSLVNQLASRGCAVVVDFEAGESGVMSYLNRAGFFDLLHPDVKVKPVRPRHSTALIYRGKNSHLVEFLRVHPSQKVDDIPSRLANALQAACSDRSDKEKLGYAAFTVFAELIGNIYDHSQSRIDGYAAFQLYRHAAIVVVSDSGVGLLETIRPALGNSRLSTLSDPQLIVHMLNEGISRHGSHRGAGLRQTAEHALKYKARLDLRLSTSGLRLVPGKIGYRPDTAYGLTGLPRLHGTHISFRFKLDNNP